MKLSSMTGTVLIVGLTPYFLERENFWFEKNFSKILEARKTQPFFAENILPLKKGQKYNLSHLLRKLDEMGYEKVYQVQEIGEFSQKGGVIEIFPINSGCIFRFEFLGNQITEIEQTSDRMQVDQKVKERLTKKLKSQKLFSDLKNIKEGDYLVHLDHGVGCFRGLSYLTPNALEKEEEINDAKYNIPNTGYYVLEYAAGDKLYVPLGLERKLSRYLGFALPKISRLGSALWSKTKKKIKEEAEKLAKELLDIYAQREITNRPPYSEDKEIEQILASTFKHKETPDQIRVMEEIGKDMAGSEPIDRIICGDVGFGKTEIALRTITRVAANGYQSAMICPTTILAHQHFQNFQKRLGKLPIKLSLLSRLQTRKEQKEITEKLKAGKIDIIIGTHRLLSKDVEFKNLSLLIIDDEHRFGVKQKERFKKMRANLDIISLSATPIPRTLYLSLSALKKISLIQMPPLGRLPIKTFVLPFKKKVIKKAIEQEISRGGQAYFLFNKVQTIGRMKEFLEKLLPQVKISIAHGKLKEKELIEVMDNFQQKKIDVLVTTTIIESGIDLPNVNTLIVADSARLGLSQAYQIRGRVGRSHLQAFAYFLHPKKISPLAKERLQALKEAEELGSGYQIALKDLEIRGAGNILGKEQSGNINSVGLNLYCQMLSESIEKIKSVNHKD